MRTVKRAVVGTVVFFLVAPTVVAGLVPWMLTRWELGRVHAGPASLMR